MEDLNKQWEGYSNASEVWIFQSSLQIEDDKKANIVSDSRIFASQWSSHGAALQATASLFYNRFLIFIVNGNEGPSGCSKDSLTHFVQSLGNRHEIDFFNRMQVLYRNSHEKLIEMHLNDMKAMYERNVITDNTTVYNNLVKNKYDLLNNWEVPVKDSWHNQFI